MFHLALLATASDELLGDCLKARLLMLTTMIFALTVALAPCWVQGKQGSGVLYVYEDANGVTVRPPTGPPQGSGIDIVPGEMIYIQVRLINGISEGFAAGNNIMVRVKLSGHVTTLGPTTLSNGGLGTLKTGILPWTVGAFDDGNFACDMQYCDTGVVFYGNQANYRKAQNMFGTNPGGHLHVIPEVPFGPVVPLAAGLCALALVKRKRP